MNDIKEGDVFEVVNYRDRLVVRMMDGRLCFSCVCGCNYLYDIKEFDPAKLRRVSTFQLLVEEVLGK